MKMRMAALMVGALAVAGVATAQKETRGVSKTEIVLGMHTDLSGPAATYGVSSSNAVKMRFDEANATGGIHGRKIRRSEEHTSELQSHVNLVCRLLLEKKKLDIDLYDHRFDPREMIDHQ